MKNILIGKLLFILTGLTLGLWISWPGIVKPKSWSCAIKIVTKKKEVVNLHLTYR